MKKGENAKEPHRFSKETLQSLRELGELFAKIHVRMISEGYVIQDGEVIKVVNDKNHGGTSDTGKPDSQ